VKAIPDRGGEPGTKGELRKRLPRQRCVELPESPTRNEASVSLYDMLGQCRELLVKADKGNRALITRTYAVCYVPSPCESSVKHQTRSGREKPDVRTYRPLVSSFTAPPA
jgi:hypothetical protein